MPLQPRHAWKRRLCLAGIWPLAGSLGNQCAEPSAEGSPQTGAPRDFESLSAWLQQEGATIHPCLVVAACANGGGACAVARCPLSKGEQVLLIPRAAQLLPAEHTPVCPQIEKLLQTPIASGGFAEWQFRAESIDLMLRLLSEQRRGSESRWAPYLQTLSRELPPIMWDEGVQRSCFEGTPLGGEGITLRFARRAAERELLVRCGAANESLDDKALLSWAIHIVTARTYSKIISRTGVGGCALVPIGDLLNHDPDPNCHWTRDAITNKFEIVTAVDVGADEELTMSYGSKGNQELVTNYGFAHSDNPHDGVMMDIMHHVTPSGSRWLRLPLSPAHPHAHSLSDTLRTLRSLLEARSNASLIPSAAVGADAADVNADVSDATMAGIAVGDRVEAEYESSGRWLGAEVAEVLVDGTGMALLRWGMVSLRWDDRSLENTVKPVDKLRRPGSRVELEAESLSVVRSSCLEAQERWVAGPVHTGTCLVYRASLAALAGACIDFADRALVDVGRPPADGSDTRDGSKANGLADILHSIWQMDMDGRLPRSSVGAG